MDIRGTKMEDNIFFHDTYDMFFAQYNQGDDVAAVTDNILKFWEKFGDFPDHTNILFAVALAQWETKSLDPQIYHMVRLAIENGWDLDRLKSNGADESTLQERKIVLDEFLTQISTEREKAKMRVRPHIDDNAIEIIHAPAPDNAKVFRAWENYTDKSNPETISAIKWSFGAACAVFHFEEVGKVISVRWVDNSTLEVTHDKSIVFKKKHDRTFITRDIVTIIYKETDGRTLDGDSTAYVLYQ